MNNINTDQGIRAGSKRGLRGILGRLWRTATTDGQQPRSSTRTLFIPGAILAAVLCIVRASICLVEHKHFERDEYVIVIAAAPTEDTDQDWYDEVDVFTRNTGYTLDPTEEVMVCAGTAEQAGLNAWANQMCIPWIPGQPSDHDHRFAIPLGFSHGLVESTEAFVDARGEDTTVEHFVARRPTADFLVFSWSPPTPDGKWPFGRDLDTVDQARPQARDGEAPESLGIPAERRPSEPRFQTF
jgi:hypothetical protein